MSGIEAVMSEKVTVRPGKVPVMSGKEAVMPEKTAVMPEKIAVMPDKIAVMPEKVAVMAEKVAVMPEKIAVMPEKMAVMQEKIAVMPEKMAVMQEKIAVMPEKMAVMSEKVTVMPGKVPVMPEKVEIMKGKVSMISGKETVMPEKVAVVSEKVIMPENVALMSGKVAVVTGSNKGVGFATVKLLCKKFDGTVYLTSRDEARGKAAVVELNKLGLEPAYHQLDVIDRDSVEIFRDHIKNNHGGIDILINNAAVANPVSLYNSYEECKYIVDINYKSLLIVQELLFPLVRDNGRIINISSDCGHLSNVRNKYWMERLSRKDLTVEDINEFVEWYLDSEKNGTFNRDDIADEGTVAAYRVAKVAVSALTMLQQKELASRNISVNSMHPGLVRTDMTGGAGFYSADQAAETPVYLALEAPESLKGAFIWHDRQVLDWYDHKGDWFFKTSALQQ